MSVVRAVFRILVGFLCGMINWLKMIRLDEGIPGSISRNSALINLKRLVDSDSLRRECISGCIATLIACIVKELKAEDQGGHVFAYRCILTPLARRGG